jgi:P27 family predicted phage terminase small subunit
MGKRGPRPTPTAVLKLRGTHRPHRTRNEPEPPPGTPPCPAWLDEQGKNTWGQLVPQLEAMGVLREVDANALGRYCVLWGRWRAAEDFLQKNGSVYTLKDEAGKVRAVMQFPQVSIAHKLALALARLEAEFGMTPSSRSRIQALPRDQDEDDPLREFMKLAE